MKCASCRTFCSEDLNRIKLSYKIGLTITVFLQFVLCRLFFKERKVSELELLPCSGKSVGTHVPVCDR